MSFYTIGIFLWGAEIFLLPIILVLFLAGLSGLITIPIGLYRFIKKQALSKWLVRSIGLATGFYIGLLLQNPIGNWDEEQRNISGNIIATELDEFKLNNKTYPDSLTQLDLEELDKSLPATYKVNRFTYMIRNGEYDLDIPIPIFDRWHWNKDKKEFEYDAF